MGAVIALAGVAVALLGVAFALLYAPGAPGYTLTADTLTIHDRFYPVTLRAEDVDVGQARIVDLTADPEWRPTLRTNGFSNLHYHAGWYRVAGGKKVRMYRADCKQVVLLPPRGAGVAVLYEVGEPARFIAELRRQWVC